MEFTRGDTKKYKFQRIDKDKNVIETKSQKMWFTVKDNVYTDKILIEKTLENGTITFDNEFYYHILLNHDDTKDLSYRKYVCDIQVENEGVVTTIYKDDLILTEEVTFKGGNYDNITLVPELEEQAINVEPELIVINTSGTSDYNSLSNKPQINSVELAGNKTLDELGIQAKGNYIEDSNYVHTDNNFTNEDKEKLSGLSNYDDTEIRNLINTKQDKGDYALKSELPTKTSELTNDSGYIAEEQDPTVPSFVKNITEENITSWNNKSDFGGSYNDLTNKPTIPTSTSQLTNDSDYTTNAYVNGLIGDINSVLASLTTVGGGS